MEIALIGLGIVGAGILFGSRAVAWGMVIVAIGIVALGIYGLIRVYPGM